jgi:hypothetical protein
MPIRVGFHHVDAAWRESMRQMLVAAQMAPEFVAGVTEGRARMEAGQLDVLFLPLSVISQADSGGPWKDLPVVFIDDLRELAAGGWWSPNQVVHPQATPAEVQAAFDAKLSPRAAPSTVTEEERRRQEIDALMARYAPDEYSG